MHSGTLESKLPMEAVERLLGGQASLTLLGGGRNSKVFRASTSDGRVLALKVYHHHPWDSRDRLGIEFGAFSFLWGQGLRCIPRPLATDRQSHLAIYEFIEGKPVQFPTVDQIDEAVGFLVDLHRLSGLEEARGQPEASEARFSFQGISTTLHQRVERLLAIGDVQPRLQDFLQREFLPSMQALLSDIRARCAAWGMSFEQEIPTDQRTLSPSDFGFHNALLREGRLCYLDFEYFGWDDPAKLLSDLLLHPAMDLGSDLRRRFAEGLLTRLDVQGLARRTRLTFPLFGLKWCLILLNEYLEEALERRAFADAAAVPASERQERQLEKARMKLQQILDEHEHFPCFDLPL